MNTIGASSTHLQNQLRALAVECVQVTDGRLATKFQWHARQGTLKFKNQAGLELYVTNTLLIPGVSLATAPVVGTSDTRK